MRRIKKITRLAFLLALAIVLHIAEGMIVLPTLPGIRLGLANIIGLICLYMYGWQAMLVVSFLRVILASLLTGSFLGTGFFLSLSGTLCSCFVLLIVYKRLPLSILGMSVLSAAFHGLGQILMIIYIYNTLAMISYLPILLFSAVPTGLFTGYLSYLVLKYLGRGE